MDQSNTKYFSLALAFIGLLSFSVRAQMLQDQDLLLQPSELLNSNNYLGNGNSAYIQQIGESNELELLQLQKGSIGDLTKVLQNGNRNLALISQNGGGNKLALVQQGDLNTYQLINAGVGNQLVTIQQGNGNIIHQELVQSNQIYSEMVQIGNANEITTIIEGINNREFKVRQIGNGLKVIIRESGY